MYGQTGNDTFRFIPGFGADTIIGFEVDNGAERIDLSLINGISDLTDLIDNHMSQVGAHVVIDDLAGNTITIENVALADLLDGNDFILA